MNNNNVPRLIDQNMEPKQLLECEESSEVDSFSVSVVEILLANSMYGTGTLQSSSYPSDNSV
jgi:hypothetical protein